MLKTYRAATTIFEIPFILLIVLVFMFLFPGQQPRHRLAIQQSPKQGPSIFLPGGTRDILVVKVPLRRNEEGVLFWDTSKLGGKLAGHLEGTSYPGQPGNSVIVGHNYGDFGVLLEAKVNSLITYKENGEILVYYISEIRQVKRQNGTHWARDKGDERLTLITSITSIESQLIIAKRLEH